MQRDDLPLFVWQPARQVLLFPLTNRVGKIRHTAAKLARKHGEDAELYWKQVTAANRKHLARLGMADDEIDVELRAFFEAVRNEMVRQSCCSRSGGAG